MSTDRISQLRQIANKHKGKHKSAEIILECLDALEDTNRLYCMAIDSAFGSFRGKAVAAKKLKDLVKG